MLEINLRAIRSRFRRLLMIAPVAALLIAASAEASLIVSVGNVFADSPSSGNTLEVNLTNTGPVSISLAGFSFEIEVTDPHITFTSATIGTGAAYVFAGNSLLGPKLAPRCPAKFWMRWIFGPAAGALRLPRAPRWAWVMCSSTFRREIRRDW